MFIVYGRTLPLPSNFHPYLRVVSAGNYEQLREDRVTNPGWNFGR